MSDAPDTRSPIIIEDETLRSGYTVIPNFILRHPDISAGAKLAYIVLLSYAWQAGSCFPGQERMAEDMGSGKRSIVRYMQELEEAGLLEVKRRGLGQTNVYSLTRWREPRSANLAFQEVPKTTPPEVPKRHTNKTQFKNNAERRSTSTERKERRKLTEEELLDRYRKSAENAGFPTGVDTEPA